MLIKGSISSNKTEIIITKYIKLINSGINPREILVLLLNSYKKAAFIKQINCEIKDFKAENIYTFSGLCYNSFLDNWKFISKYLGRNDVTEQPNLCGLEISQYIFKESIKTADFSDYISKVNLLHQLFRRYSLIVQNCLTNEEVNKRSKILGESFANDAQNAIDDYKIRTFKYNSFDYLRQLAVLPLIYKNTDYFKNIRYLIVDDADEFPFAFWNFTDCIIKNLNEYIIAYDEKGSCRCGYLCAYKSGIYNFIKKYSPKIFQAKETSCHYDDSNKLFTDIQLGKKTKIACFTSFSFVKRLDMIQRAAEKIKEIISYGVQPEEIAVITPVQDDVLFESLESAMINFQTISGSEKLIDNIVIRHIVTLLKIINNIKISEYEIKNILIKLLKIPFNQCLKILKTYTKENCFIPFCFENETLNYNYGKFLSLIKAQQKFPGSISEQIKLIDENLLKIFNIDVPVQKYNFLLKEAESFEKAFKDKIQNMSEEFIIQIENSIISENSADAIKIIKDKIVVSTPQKIIDFAYKNQYQLWLDVSSSEWIKNDTGTLYNAWALSKDWQKSQFTLDDNIRLTNDKTARTLRKLLLCSNQNILLFSSLYDNSGNENFGGIIDFIETEQKKKAEFNIIPRKDQMPVLNYKKGKLGIMAVPGAGKTTILLALIIKLLKEGTKSENIFVLTYMESAAKNFKERIKAAMPECSDLPNISTIHGLALRIIKENGNYNKIGLDENFEICDDNTKENIIRGLFFKLKINDENYEKYIKCISDIKLACIKKELRSKYRDIQDFFNFYNEYNKYLKQNNLIDYDDMLCFAVQILEEYSDIRKYYQNLCKYIIEDEAQDSTDIQQRLINIICSKHNNLVRCGDVNQSITSTFTNSNPDSFKYFIDANKKVEMTSSQRCSKQVYSLANLFVKDALIQTNAFYDIQMKETGKNPLTDKYPEYRIFETENEEKNFIINAIKKIQIEDTNATIAILLRLNSQVNEYNELFLSQDIKTNIRSDCPAQKSVYKIIFMTLKIILNPINNNNILDFALFCSQKGIYKLNQFDLDFLKNLKSPFILLNPDDLHSQAILQLYFDINYHLNNSTVPYDILALNIGLYYSENSSDKTNTYIISTLIKRISKNCINPEDLLTKLDFAAQKNSLTYRFFDEQDDISNSVSIMTMHKAKGDEFDYVFIPEFNENNYSTQIDNIKIKADTHFNQAVKAQALHIDTKSQEELKKEQINETLRLIYVGITRAKKTVCFTNAKNYKRRKNTKEVEIIKNCINNIS